MQTYLFILLALALIAALIWILHKNQLKKSLEIAEQSNPLPPLEHPGSREGHTIKVGLAAEMQSRPREPVIWQDEVRLLRESGRFQEALSLCRRQYPKMLAFRQSLITLRAKIREENTGSGDVLNALYQTAVQGDWVKAQRQEGIPEVDITLQLQRFEHPEHYWDRLGYRHLDLLTKTDCKMLVEHWGEPGNHGNIRDIVEPGGNS